MGLVIADTGPVHYLLLIEQVYLLPVLFKSVLIPAAVSRRDARSKDPRGCPPMDGQWMSVPPPWLGVLPNPVPQPDPILAELDEGERAAIQLALELQATLVLIDDRAGVVAAKRKGLLVTGTLGVLDLAAEHGLIDIGPVIQRLTATNFRYPQALIDRFLEAHQSKRTT